MAKIPIDYKDYFAYTTDMLAKHGLLLCTADSQGNPNVMTIGWATLGSIWTKPAFIVLVRPSRYSYELIEQNPEFTVNVPLEEHRQAIAHCGTITGRGGVNKFEDTGLTPVAAEEVSVPVIEQCPVNFECKVVHKTDMIPGEVPDDIKKTFYKSDDYHRVYFGEIVTAYASEGFNLDYST